MYLLFIFPMDKYWCFPQSKPHTTSNTTLQRSAGANRPANSNHKQTPLRIQHRLSFENHFILFFEIDSTKISTKTNPPITPHDYHPLSPTANLFYFLSFGENCANPPSPHFSHPFHPRGFALKGWYHHPKHHSRFLFHDCFFQNKVEYIITTFEVNSLFL